MSDNKAVFKFISVDKLILNPHSALIQGDSNHKQHVFKRKLKSSKLNLIFYFYFSIFFFFFRMERSNTMETLTHLIDDLEIEGKIDSNFF